MKLTIIFIIIVSLGLFVFMKKQKENNIKHPAVHSMNTSELKEIISSDATIQLVDVRTALEFGKGYIQPAVNIDYMAGGFAEKFNSYNKNEPLYLYCRSGNRSSKAANILAKEGFTEIYDLDGGILEWNK